MHSVWTCWNKDRGSGFFAKKLIFLHRWRSCWIIAVIRSPSTGSGSVAKLHPDLQQVQAERFSLSVFVKKTSSRSKEFPCVFSSLVVFVKQNSNEAVEVTVYRSHGQSCKVAHRAVVFQRFRTEACGFTVIHFWLTRKLESFVSSARYVQ